MTFDPRTATKAEFEAEARRLHGLRLQRIRDMTPEEQQACARFMIDGYFQRAATLRVNELWGPEDMDIQIAECVKHYRIDNFQSSAEYEAERDRLVEADRARRGAEASERARQEAAERNARARWIAQGNDPSVLPDVGGAARATPGAPVADAEIVVDVPDPSLHDVIVDAARQHLNKGEWAGTLRIVGPGGDQQFDEAGNEITPPDGEAPDGVLEGIDAAIHFHETRTGLRRNIRQWQSIRAAIVAGEVSPALKAQVERAAGGARPGAKYYDLWMAVRDRVRALPVQ
ncbi:MAG: hypothetical protein F4Y03_09360 [Alphaproteobacteria bacterium]|nr:hypothetical protein [Alphaproteobacteria bacterium]